MPIKCFKAHATLQGCNFFAYEAETSIYYTVLFNYGQILSSNLYITVQIRRNTPLNNNKKNSKFKLKTGKFA